MRAYDLSNGRLALTFEELEGRLQLARFSGDGNSWLHPELPSPVLALTVGGRRWTAADLALEGVEEVPSAPGSREARFTLRGPGWHIAQHVRVYEAAQLVEIWQIVTNDGSTPIHIERLDTLALDLPKRPMELLAFTSDWGIEFEPQRQALTGPVVLESRAGRSSKGHHPWFALFDEGQHVLSGTVAWSGNWVIRLEPLPAGGWALSGGLHDWAFGKELEPGAALASAPMSLVVGQDLNTVSQDYARVGRRYWYPVGTMADRLPVEWNHWWPYEDADISAEVFARNVEAAAGLGVELCTLDAGWFGPAEDSAHWGHYRGDWQRVNTRRFPAGVRAVADHVHALGMKFGLWCEIEGLGEKAALASERPELAAERDGQRLGYVCFGNPEAQALAFETMAGLLTDYSADWLKIDFNLDPGAGCNRTDHGHAAGDGLYEHVGGYYLVLERLRQAFPRVAIENCSSGGLRIDLGLMRRTDVAYLSDPDWPEHSLQVFWGASTMLAADRLLHWAFSQWRPNSAPARQSFNPHAPALTQKKWDYYARIAMLGAFGLSHKLPNLPAWLLQRIKVQIRLYQQHVRRFVKEADLYRLTDQPRRDGTGERWAAFQYSLPDQSEHLLFVFRLPGAEAERAVRLQGLEPERRYRIAGLENDAEHEATGRELMAAGLVFRDLLEEDSALLRLS